MGQSHSGPDGCSLAAFKSNWDSMKENLMEAIRAFHRDGFLDHESRATYIALILKKKGAERFKDFRMVSLVLTKS